MTEQVQRPRPHARRGVRLSDLDRAQVYRIGYVVQRRRWEVLGPGGSGVAERDAAEPDAPDGKRSAAGAPAAGPRHAASEPAG
ncbi:hypothetical protein SAMN05443575_4020 [Jatrophihabitans endophyticus]|uniref:Uncharacterized protein n=1 Tax=Jatrophihabitans endophyticus TaxID=1206085 RepID=A0A1M5TS03_9ACTN|nr:hypothetical protein [Jatrophihabitans endophyticus]SHH53504.1 hypothetical protein SAMN05443575_4020 [Jatrophihabitans endophyticus]